jgi:hypothetical protein
MRILWVVCYLACFGYSLSLVINSVNGYYKFETTVSIRHIRETPTVFPAVTICNLNPFDELYSYDAMAEIAKNYNQTKNCTDKKVVLINRFLNIIMALVVDNYSEYKNYTICMDLQHNNSSSPVNQTGSDGFQVSWCNMSDYDLANIIINENEIILLSNWTVINEDWTMSAFDAFDLLGWPYTGWFRYMAKTSWTNWTIGEWLTYFNIDRTILINQADNLNDCLKLMSPDDINHLLNQVKRSLANKNMTFLERALLGFNLNLDMLDSCQFNQENCIIDGWSNNDTVYTSFFSFILSNDYGGCYTFNDGKYGPILQLSEAGADYGLKMTLRVGRSNFKRKCRQTIAIRFFNDHICLIL